MNVYVLDTGIDPTHPDFGGRASVVRGIVDCNGHGTRIAGVIGSTTFGIAKQAKLRGVSIDNDCDDSFTSAELTDAINWVKVHFSWPAVANLSLIVNGHSNAVNQATQALQTAGVFVVAAAGNTPLDVCSPTTGRSPANLATIITVASANPGDTQDPSSGWGSCIDLYAPGGQFATIPTTGLGGGSAVTGGSSAATAFVSGWAAIRKTNHPGEFVSEMQAVLLASSTNGAVLNIRPNTANRLLYARFPFYALVLGPNQVPEYTWAVFQADVRYGVPPYTYQWYRNGVPLCTTASCQMFTGERMTWMYVRLDVRDAINTLSSQTKNVYTLCPDGSYLCDL